MRTAPSVLAFLLCVACVDTDAIDTTLQRQPDRGSVRVLSLLSDADVTLTREGEAPVAFSNRESLSPWRTQVTGEVSGFLMREGTVLSSLDAPLEKDARATLLVAPEGLQWIIETREPAPDEGRVRLLRGSATLEGQALSPEWSESLRLESGTLVAALESGEARFGPISVLPGELVTLALLPGETPRLLVSVEREGGFPPENRVIQAD